jgi:hypothetical protein
MKLAYLDIRETSIPFSNPYWAGIIPKNLLSFVQFHREPVTLAHSIAGRYLLWKLLLQLDKTDVDNLNIGKTDNGKIFFPDKNLHFNISHSGDMVVCALSDDSPMGIDIEHMLHVSFADFRNIIYFVQADNGFKYEVFHKNHVGVCMVWRYHNAKIFVVGRTAVPDVHGRYSSVWSGCSADVGRSSSHRSHPPTGPVTFRRGRKVWF